MMNDTKRGITPYRMQQLMNVASDVSNRIVNSRHAQANQKITDRRILDVFKYTNGKKAV